MEAKFTRHPYVMIHSRTPILDGQTYTRCAHPRTLTDGMLTRYIEEAGLPSAGNHLKYGDKFRFGLPLRGRQWGTQCNAIHPDLFGHFHQNTFNEL